MAKGKTQKQSDGSALDFEAQLWAVADKMRGYMDTTWKLTWMNLAIRGIDANLGLRNADSFRADLRPDLKADFILANPPFNMSDWGGENLRQDVRKLAAESRAAGQEAFNKGMEDKSCKLLNGEVSFTNA